MRITGGFLKGQKLYTPGKGRKNIRPLRSRIRKALFDIIGQDLTGLKILDLFAGTGALGIEALSRGAEKVVFVDSSKESVEIIKKNLIKFNLWEKAKIFRGKLPEFLKILVLERGTFDLVFVTPPYGKGLALKTLQNFPPELLKEEGIIIVEERVPQSLPETTGNFSLFKQKTYGETSLNFYQKKK